MTYNNQGTLVLPSMKQGIGVQLFKWFSQVTRELFFLMFSHYNFLSFEIFLRMYPWEQHVFAACDSSI